MVSGTTLHSITLPGQVWKVSPRISPNGRFIVVHVIKQLSQRSANRAADQTHCLALIEWATGDLRAEFLLPDGVSLASLAISSDGKTIAAGCSDTSILLYDASLRSAGNSTEKSSADELWKQLAGGNAADAWRAACELQSRPEIALPLLRQHIRPAAMPAKPDPATIAKWIAKLDAPQFNDREEAQKQLLRHAGFVADAVRAALKNNATLEARKRLTRIIAELDKPQQLEVINARALELLENCGTAESRSFVAELADGDPASILTREAKLTLVRMSDRRAK